MNSDKILNLFNSKLVVINVGPKLFADALDKQGVDTVKVDWVPPAGGDEKMMYLLSIMGGI